MKGCFTAACVLALSVCAAGVLAQQKENAQDGAKATETKPANPAPTTMAVIPNDPTYVIGPSDVLKIDVWKQPDVSGTVPVRPDGKISLPLIEDVMASGATPLQLQATITDKLKGFIANPVVTVIVTEVNSQRIYVIGQVGHPGPVNMLPNMTVLQAIASAGGPAQFAKDKSIYILRTENGKQQKYPFNYPDVIKGKRPEMNILLKPGDTIVVP